MPYTDTRELADPNSKVIYRLYYETVHWINASAISQVDGSKWYYLWDDKFKQFYYAPAWATLDGRSEPAVAGPR